MPPSILWCEGYAADIVHAKLSNLIPDFPEWDMIVDTVQSIEFEKDYWVHIDDSLHYVMQCLVSDRRHSMILRNYQSNSQDQYFKKFYSLEVRWLGPNKELSYSVPSNTKHIYNSGEWIYLLVKIV